MFYFLKIPNILRSFSFLTPLFTPEKTVNQKTKSISKSQNLYVLLSSRSGGGSRFVIHPIFVTSVSVAFAIFIFLLIFFPVSVFLLVGFLHLFVRLLFLFFFFPLPFPIFPFPFPFFVLSHFNLHP